MESWRRYLNESGFGEGTPPDGEFYKKQIKYLEEDNGGRPKVIFMSGAPGSGKTTVINKLGLENMEIINPDEFYEPALEKAGLGKNIRKIKEDYLVVRDELKEVLSDILRLEEPEDGWSHDILMEMYDDALKSVGDLRSAVYNLETIKERYDEVREKIVTQGKIFAQAQKDAKSKQADVADQGKSFIIDGTGGFFARIRNQKAQLEEMGYDTAMVFVDIPLEIAIDRQEQRGREGGRTLDARAIEKSWTAVNKNLEPYQELFEDNFFHVSGVDEEMDESVAEAQSKLSRFMAGQQLNEADWQKWVRANYNKQVGAYTRGGNNKTKPSGWKEAPVSYRGAPPGAPGG